MFRFSSTCAIAVLLLSSHSAWSQAVEFRMETTDLGGAPLSTVSVGDEFLLSVYTQHVSDFFFGGSPSSNPADAGLFAPFLDINYDGGVASTTGPIDHAQRFSTAASGELTAGLINNVGGVATDPGSGVVPTPPGAIDELVFSLPLRADAAGTLDFVGSAANDGSFFDVLVFGRNTAVDPADVDFGMTSLTVVPEPGGFACIMLGTMGLLLTLRRRRR